MTRRPKRAAVLLALAGSLAFILWITLLSRFGSDVRHIYTPFWSYREIINGDLSLLLEDAENILLFVPVGLLLSWLFRLNLGQTVLLGFLCSLTIECGQWLFWLGSFEVDDLLHNTVGALIGAVFAQKTDIGRQVKQLFKKKDLLLIAVLTVAFLTVPFSGQWMHRQSMKRIAALSDLDNGKANLLVLDGRDAVIEDTEIRVSYNDDGSITVDGASAIRTWFTVGKVTLPAGTYRLTGLSRTPETEFDLELEYLDRPSRTFIRLATVDSEQDAVFTLEAETRLRLLVGVFPGTEGTENTRPAIYRED